LESYPGCACDVESLEYSYGWSNELQQDFSWSTRYSPQPEILKYLNFVADRFDLRKDISLNTKVVKAKFDTTSNHWTITTENGQEYVAKFLILATGCLSFPKQPDFKGVNTFQGKTYLTGKWPENGVDFTGQRVAVIGTGSSAVQSIPIIAKQASQLYVFQRTPSFTVPAQNAPLDREFEASIKAKYPEIREKARNSGFGIINIHNNPDPTGNLPPPPSALSVSEEERRKIYQTSWEKGGFLFLLSFSDLLFNKEANDTACDFIRSKVKELVKDPETAELLCPTEYPVGTKRMCIDTDYFVTYNQPNVKLLSVKKNLIDEITPKGVKLQDGQEFEVDSIVFAIGFDAMTGALTNIDLQGTSPGKTLKEKWSEGPKTYLGVSTEGFPNMFFITGPGSPSVLSNMVLSSEVHCNWITDVLKFMRDQSFDRIEATSEAENQWVEHVNDIGSKTLFPLANSWYVGANVPGKARVFMPYVGGCPAYHSKIHEVAGKGYEGYELTRGEASKESSSKV
jgi:cyclohexanone monooxygenase